MRAAVSCATFISLYPSLWNPTEKVLISGLIFAMEQINDESIPPDKKIQLNITSRMDVYGIQQSSLVFFRTFESSILKGEK